MIDVFTAAGLAKPDVSILTDGFLTEVRCLKHKSFDEELRSRRSVGARPQLEGFLGSITDAPESREDTKLRSRARSGALPFY